MTLLYSVVGEQPIAANATMNVHWRSDPHEWRNTPHADPLRYANRTCVAGASNANVRLDNSVGSTVPLANAASPPYFGADAVRLLATASGTSSFQPPSWLLTVSMYAQREGALFAILAQGRRLLPHQAGDDQNQLADIEWLGKMRLKSSKQ